MWQQQYLQVGIPDLIRNEKDTSEGQFNKQHDGIQCNLSKQLDPLRQKR